MKLVRNLIYKLKREYGQPAILRRETATSKDYGTGVSTISIADYSIKKAILLPTKLKSQFSYDLAFIAANKNFTYGGLYDQTNRIIMLDARDISIKPQTNDQIVFGSNKYIIIDFINALDDDVYILITKGNLADGN